MDRHGRYRGEGRLLPGCRYRAAAIAARPADRGRGSGRFSSMPGSTWRCALVKTRASLSHSACMIGGRARRRPVLQHDRHWLVRQLRMGLQKAIKAQEPAGLRLVAEPPAAHQCDMVAHQVSKDAAEGRESGEAPQVPDPDRARTAPAGWPVGSSRNIRRADQQWDYWRSILPLTRKSRKRLTMRARCSSVVTAAQCIARSRNQA